MFVAAPEEDIETLEEVFSVSSPISPEVAEDASVTPILLATTCLPPAVEPSPT